MSRIQRGAAYTTWQLKPLIKILSTFWILQHQNFLVQHQEEQRKCRRKSQGLLNIMTNLYSPQNIQYKETSYTLFLSLNSSTQKPGNESHKTCDLFSKCLLRSDLLWSKSLHLIFVPSTSKSGQVAI